MACDSETSQAFEKTLKGPTAGAVTPVQRRAMSSFIILLIVPSITSHISRRPISVLHPLPTPASQKDNGLISLDIFDTDSALPSASVNN